MTQMSRSATPSNRGMTAGLCFLAGAALGAAIVKLKAKLLAEPPIGVKNTALDISILDPNATWLSEGQSTWKPDAPHQRTEFRVSVLTKDHPCPAGEPKGARVDITYGGTNVRLMKVGKVTKVISALPLTASGPSLGHPGNDGDFISRIEVRKTQGGSPIWSCDFTADDQLNQIYLH